ncbi:MAG: PD-(D/E)XK nuclease family protein [Desulfobacteraceae bacterium]
MTLSRSFATAAAAQQYVMEKATPGTLILVPHDRLARQLWHAERQRNLSRGLAGWEPRPILTLNQWFQQLFESLWPRLCLAADLERCRLWEEAMPSGPPLGELPLDLTLARRLDEAHAILCRHLSPPTQPAGEGPPLVAWRRAVSQIFEACLAEKHLITPGQLPGYLLQELHRGKISLPPRILALGFEAPAPVEAAWFQELANRTDFDRLLVQGSPRVVLAAVTLPDVEQEMQWVAARILEAAHQEGLEPHRVAVTSPAMDDYAPGFQRMLAELLGPPRAADRAAYNFSRGSTLTEHPLFQAGILPLSFFTEGETRATLVSLLLSTYYEHLAVHSELGAGLDWVFREQGLDHGWARLRQAWQSQPDWAVGLGGELCGRLEQALGAFMVSRQSGREWVACLRQAWDLLGFAVRLDDQEVQVMTVLEELLGELGRILGPVRLEGRKFLSWLRHGAQRRLLAGTGREEAGFQVMGLLEMRGLDFDRVFCLGMNAGVFPWPRRDLPLLDAAERRQVLGGTLESQYAFAKQIFASLLGVAPHLTLTRPHLMGDEPLAATPIWTGDWAEATVDHVSQPEPAWLRVPAVREALLHPVGRPVVDPDGPVSRVLLPAELSITAIDCARACPCRFFLENLLDLSPLPNIEAGPPALQRGARLHKALAWFVQDYKIYLKKQNWDEVQARAALKAAVTKALEPASRDLHWQVELERWLSEDEEAPGFLWRWLEQEKERHAEGWEWAAVEVQFAGVSNPHWPFTLKGRIDRLDQHPQQSYMVWDYKCGQIPKRSQMFDERLHFQLIGYLMALQQGRVKLAAAAGPARAGYIQLKSSRAVKFETWGVEPSHWEAELAEWELLIAQLGKRLQQGNFLPDPRPAPQPRDEGACQYCPYRLICGYRFLEANEEADS